MEARDCSDMMTGSWTEESQVATWSWKRQSNGFFPGLQKGEAQLTQFLDFWPPEG